MYRTLKPRIQDITARAGFPIFLIVLKSTPAIQLMLREQISILMHGPAAGYHEYRVSKQYKLFNEYYLDNCISLSLKFKHVNYL